MTILQGLTAFISICLICYGLYILFWRKEAIDMEKARAQIANAHRTDFLTECLIFLVSLPLLLLPIIIILVIIGLILG